MSHFLVNALVLTWWVKPKEIPGSLLREFLSDFKQHTVKLKQKWFTAYKNGDWGMVFNCKILFKSKGQLKAITWLSQDLYI